jgi:hypothetical protein
MKKISIAIVGLAFLLQSCKPDLKGSQGDPSNKLEGMNGVWEMSTFIQQDPNNPIKEERDLSEFYIVDGETPYHLEFSKNDKTYSVTPGPGKNYFGTGGTWAFDNDDFPTYLYLYNPTDTLELTLGSVVRPTDNVLSIELESSCVSLTTGQKTVTSIYRFNFNRVSQ